LATDALAPILELADVVAGYGAMTILNGTTFRIRRGTITTIIGPNGAGKSTVFKTVFGLLQARSGRVIFDGADATNAGPRRLIGRGMTYLPQGRNIFPELSVRHNLELGGVAAKTHDVVARVESAMDRSPQGQPAGFNLERRRAEAARDRARFPARPQADLDR
jgi:branched-chain amino acid transport system ATP-binding protein